MAAESFSGAPEQQSTVSDCADHLLYSAFQKPVTAVAQAVDKLATTNLVESTKFIDAPKQAEFGSAKWHAEQIASGVGSIVPFVASMAIAKPLLRPLQAPLLETFGNLPAQTLLSRYALGEAATAGFIQGSVFEPTRADSQDSFLASRFKQGITGATTMSVLHASSNALGRFTGAAEAEAGIIRRGLTTGIAGTGAGAASYLADTAINGRSFDAKEFVQTAYTMGFTGAALGAGADGFMRLNMPKSKLPSVDEYVARSYDGASTSDHYFSWLAKQSPEGRASLLSKWLSDRFSKRNFGEDNENPSFPKLSDYAPLDRLQLANRLQRLANTDMISAKALDSFINKLTDASESFDKTDIGKLYDQLDAAKAKFDLRIEVLEKARAWASDRRPAPVITTREDGSFSAIYPDHPREVKAERRLQVARAERDQAKEALNAVLNPRLEKMNQAVNEWLAEQNLPPVKVRAGWVDGSAAYGSGDLIIHPDLLNTNHINSTHMGLILHELVHHKQESLSVRLIADELGVGKDATPEQMQQVQQRLIDRVTIDERTKARLSVRTNVEPPSEHIEKILKYRNGEKLTPAEAKQARIFQEAQRSYTAPPWLEQRQTYIHQDLEIFNLKENMSSRSLQEFFKQIAEDPESAKKNYGFKGIPEELKALAEESNAKRVDLESRTFSSFAEERNAFKGILPDDATMQRVKEILDVQIKSTEKILDKFAGKDYDWYMKSALERQAYPAGIAAFLFAQGKLQS